MGQLCSKYSSARPGEIDIKQPQQGSSNQAENFGYSSSLMDNPGFDSFLLNSSLVESGNVSNMSTMLWGKYLNLVCNDKTCIDAISSSTVRDGNFTMRFSLKSKGQKPVEGYPLYIALHGGGGGPSTLNDSQWEHMKVYYFDSIDTGIYVATRGITNNWNLHFEDASYRLYEKLIQILVAFHDVDPNRVYLLGFSAGGDGVYQVVPRMPDLWAAGNMSAGHSNGVKFDNLYQTPFLIQMGERDHAYNRHKVAAENFIELTRLHELRGGYERAIFIHCNGTHNSWSDRDASGRSYPVIANVKEWLTNDSNETIHCNTAATHWLRKYKRNPYPTKLFWDPNTNAPRNSNCGAAYLRDSNAKASLVVPRHLFYWLNLGHNPNLDGQFVIEAELDKSSNSVKLKSLGSLNYISILLNINMLNLERPIEVVVDGKSLGSVQPKLDLRTMARTLLERGDMNYVFTSEIILQKLNGAWTISKDTLIEH